MDKENVNPSLLSKKKKTKTTLNHGVREHLGDICTNLVPQNRVTSRITSHKTTIVLKLESSPLETKVKYNFKSVKTTERENKGEKISCIDEVFLSGVDHCLNHPNKSDVLKPVPEIRIHSPGEIDEIKKPSQKVILIRKVSSRKKHSNEDDLYKNCLYNEEYFKDNYKYMLDLEDNFVYGKEILKKYVNEDYRRDVVGWLHYASRMLRLNEQTLFMGIRMFDYVIAFGNFVTDEKYTVVGLTCLWIINKQSDEKSIQLPNLIILLNRKFSRTQVLLLEQKILKTLNFQINFPEPLSFLFYYLKQQKLENNPKIRCSALFILEISTLLLDFSTLFPSLLASSALHQVLVKYKLECKSFLEYISSHLFAKDVFLRESQKLEKSVSNMLASTKLWSEIVEKYSTAETYYVAKNFLPLEL